MGREPSGSDNESLTELGWSRDELSFVGLNGEEKVDASLSTCKDENHEEGPLQLGSKRHAQDGLDSRHRKLVYISRECKNWFRIFGEDTNRVISLGRSYYLVPVDFGVNLSPKRFLELLRLIPSCDESNR